MAIQEGTSQLVRVSRGLVRHRKRGGGFYIMMTLTSLRHVPRFLAIVALALSWSGRAQAGVVWHVDHNATSPGDGLTWCTAFAELSTALQLAGDPSTPAPPEVIRVAQGTYTPDPTGLDNAREATFQLVQGVTVEGGYAGCADTGAPRDITAYRTVLDGDISGDDDPSAAAGPGGTCCFAHAGPGCDDAACEAEVCAIFEDCCLLNRNWGETCAILAAIHCCELCIDNLTHCDNSYHVVNGSVFNNFAPAVLDGFTIKNGVTLGSRTSQGSGGGAFIQVGNPQFLNCTFRDNFAFRGGGAVFASTSTVGQELPYPLRFMNCIFENNTAQFSGGGAHIVDSNPTFDNCAFVRNQSNMSWAGGMFISDGTATILNTTFADNTGVARDGAGLWNDDAGAPIINGCILWNNKGSGPTDERAQFFDQPDALLPDIDYTLMQGWTETYGGTGNLGDANDLTADDPLFAPGPLGCFYLSHIAAGDGAESPAIDRGDPAADNPGLTTRGDEVPDVGIIDMGFHYPITNLPLLPGDYDRDGTVTLTDYGELTRCLTGVGPFSLPTCCRLFDTDVDEDIDLADVADFQASFTGP